LVITGLVLCLNKLTQQAFYDVRLPCNHEAWNSYASLRCVSRAKESYIYELVLAFLILGYSQFDIVYKATAALQNSTLFTVQQGVTMSGYIWNFLTPEFCETMLGPKNGTREYRRRRCSLVLREEGQWSQLERGWGYYHSSWTGHECCKAEGKLFEESMAIANQQECSKCCSDKQHETVEEIEVKIRAAVDGVDPHAELDCAVYMVDRAFAEVDSDGDNRVSEEELRAFLASERNINRDLLYTDPEELVQKYAVASGISFKRFVNMVYNEDMYRALGIEVSAETRDLLRKRLDILNILRDSKNEALDEAVGSGLQSSLVRQVDPLLQL